MSTEKIIKPVYVKNGVECYGIVLFKNYGCWRLSPSDLLAYLKFKFGEEASNYIFYKKEFIKNINGLSYDILLKRMSLKSVENSLDKRILRTLGIHGKDGTHREHQNKGGFLHTVNLCW